MLGKIISKIILINLKLQASNNKSQKTNDKQRTIHLEFILFDFRFVCDLDFHLKHQDDFEIASIDKMKIAQQYH